MPWSGRETRQEAWCESPPREVDNAQDGDRSPREEGGESGESEESRTESRESDDADGQSIEVDSPDTRVKIIYCRWKRMLTQVLRQVKKGTGSVRHSLCPRRFGRDGRRARFIHPRRTRGSHTCPSRFGRDRCPAACPCSYSLPAGGCATGGG